LKRLTGLPKPSAALGRPPRRDAGDDAKDRGSGRRTVGPLLGGYVRPSGEEVGYIKGKRPIHLARVCGERRPNYAGFGGTRQESLTRSGGGRTDATPRLLVVRPPLPSSTSSPAGTEPRRAAGVYVEPFLFQLGEHGPVATVVITNPSSDRVANEQISGGLARLSRRRQTRFKLLAYKSPVT
jgi:hypothetical protein